MEALVEFERKVRGVMQEMLTKRVDLTPELLRAEFLNRSECHMMTEEKNYILDIYVKYYASPDARINHQPRRTI